MASERAEPPLSAEELDRAARARLAALAAPYARPIEDRWAEVPASLDARIAADRGLALAAHEARGRLVHELASAFGPLEPRLLEAMHAVPRERFVLPEDIATSADDVPALLDPDGLATVSAPHVYLLAFRLLRLGGGDRFLELGTGTGYGASLARAIVGPRGHVTTIEIDPALHRRAARLFGSAPPGPPTAQGSADPFELARHVAGGLAEVTALLGDAGTLAPALLASEPPPSAVAITFAVPYLDPAIERALPDGARLVAPVGPREGKQDLVLVERRGATLTRSRHGQVRFVPDRAR